MIAPLALEVVRRIDALFEIERTINGKTYHCSTTGGEEKQAQAVLAACKSLK